jgi:hypothetical protein
VKLQSFHLSGEKDEKIEKFLKSAQTAIKHGVKAIELRMVKYNFHQQTNGGTESAKDKQHLFCIEVFSECVQKLKTWLKAFTAVAESEREIEIESLSSKFSGLEVDELYEDEGNENINTENTVAGSKRTYQDVSLESLDDDYDDRKFQFICYYLDMIAVDEYLTKTWKKVKSCEISILAATVGSYFAFRRIKSTSISLSLIFPDYKDTVDSFFAILKEVSTPFEYEWIEKQKLTKLLFTLVESYKWIEKHITVEMFQTKTSCLGKYRDFFGECRMCRTSVGFRRPKNNYPISD